MKKNLLKLLAIIAVVSVLPLSCKKQKAEEPDPDPTPVGPVVPDKQEVNLSIAPAGGEATFDVTATDSWTIEKDENYKWITFSPESGAETTSTTVTFTASANDSGRERSASFFVMQGKSTIYEVFVTQSKLEIPLGEGDYEFCKELVDGKMLGDATPVIDDWYSFDPEMFNGTGITFVNVDGLWYIDSIVACNEDIPYYCLPETMELPYLSYFRMWGNATLEGAELPQVWSTPKLEYICLSHTKMTGVIPQGLADCPALAEVYFDDTDFYGALPHIWASSVLEVVLLGSTNNCSWKKSSEEAYDGDTECPYLGYIMPETLDVVFNSEVSHQNDITQLKVGGVKEGHWLGFEKGWGQKRYEFFDDNAVAGDKETWSDWRLLIGNAEKGHYKADSDNGKDDVWLWYVSNMGFTGYNTYIPKKMLDWDQSVADAFTAAAKAAHDSKTPIDMTQFGKEKEVIPDDDIASGHVVEVDPGFWN